MQAPPSLVAFWCALGSGEQLLGRAWQPLELCSCASYTQPAGGGQASGPTQRAGTSSSTGSWQPSLPARWRRLPALPVPVVPETGGSWPVPLEPAGAHTALAVHYHSPCLGQTLWPPYSPPTPSLLRFRYYPPPLHPPYPPPPPVDLPSHFLVVEAASCALFLPPMSHVVPTHLIPPRLSLVAAGSFAWSYARAPAVMTVDAALTLFSLSGCHRQVAKSSD